VPASTFEKWLANFFYSVLIVPVGFILVLATASMLSYVLIHTLGFGQASLFNPFSTEGWKLLKFYWWLHPILFFSAIYFKKRPVLKINGVISLLIIAMLLYIAFITHLLPDHTATDLDLETYYEGMDERAAFISFSLSIKDLADKTGLLTFIKVLAWTYFPYFWGLSYLRFKELEL
jgi:hypothetical protein